MRRYWVPSEAIEGDRVRLNGDVLHHIRDVCRMRKGSRFEVLISGRALLVEIITESKNESLAQVLEERALAPRPKPDLVLVLAVPRFPVFEAVLEKAVELGVARIEPVFSEFSFIRSRDDVFAKKRPRWEKIVQGATQQSGRGDLMPIAEPRPLREALSAFAAAPAVAGLFAYEGEGVLSAKEGLARLTVLPARSVGAEGGRAANAQAPGGPANPGAVNEVHVFVGAEGGFSHDEVGLFREAGLQPVTLGAQVLRVETACVALVSILKYHFDQLR